MEPGALVALSLRSCSPLPPLVLGAQPWSPTSVPWFCCHSLRVPCPVEDHKPLGSLWSLLQRMDAPLLCLWLDQFLPTVCQTLGVPDAEAIAPAPLLPLHQVSGGGR